MARSSGDPRRKPRLRTELSEADEQRLRDAVALFGLPKAEVVRRLIRASVQAGPALSAENTQAVVALVQQVRMVGRNLAQILRAIRAGEAVDLADTELERHLDRIGNAASGVVVDTTPIDWPYCNPSSNCVEIVVPGCQICWPIR